MEEVLTQHKLANTTDQNLFLQRNIYQHSTGLSTLSILTYLMITITHSISQQKKETKSQRD